MQGGLAGFFAILFFIVCLAAAYFSGALSPRAREPVLEVQKQINQRAEETYRTGHEARVTFSSQEDGAVVVLLAPDSVIVELESMPFPLSVMEEMHRITDAQQAGSLFYLVQGRIKDHKMLSKIIEPVFGFSMQKEVNFLISSQTDPDRPVRVEIVRN